MKHKDKRYRRMQRRNHIARKRKICDFHSRWNGIPNFIEDEDIFYAPTIIEENNIVGAYYFPWFYTDCEGKLNKGKVHCSCSMCGFHETPIDDKKNMKKMISKIDDFLDENYELEEALDDHYSIYEELDLSACSDYDMTAINIEKNKLNRKIRKYKLKKGWTSHGDRTKKTKNPSLGYEEFSKMLNENAGDMDFISTGSAAYTYIIIRSLLNSKDPNKQRRGENLMRLAKIYYR